MQNGYERAAKEVIPAIRSSLARELIQKHGLTESAVSGYLGITQAAVSKYARHKCSDKIKRIEENIDAATISTYAQKIASGDRSAVNSCICTVCNMLNRFGCTYSRAEK
jgi:predicted transcriptional regulator